MSVVASVQVTTLGGRWQHFLVPSLAYPVVQIMATQMT